MEAERAESGGVRAEGASVSGGSGGDETSELGDGPVKGPPADERYSCPAPSDLLLDRRTVGVARRAPTVGITIERLRQIAEPKLGLGYRCVGGDHSCATLHLPASSGCHIRLMQYGLKHRFQSDCLESTR